jgi:hypothetical protein
MIQNNFLHRIVLLLVIVLCGCSKKPQGGFASAPTTTLIQPAPSKPLQISNNSNLWDFGWTSSGNISFAEYRWNPQIWQTYDFATGDLIKSNTLPFPMQLDVLNSITAPPILEIRSIIFSPSENLIMLERQFPIDYGNSNPLPGSPITYHDLSILDLQTSTLHTIIPNIDQICGWMWPLITWSDDESRVLFNCEDVVNVRTNKLILVDLKDYSYWVINDYFPEVFNLNSFAYGTFLGAISHSGNYLAISNTYDQTLHIVDITNLKNLGNYHKESMAKQIPNLGADIAWDNDDQWVYYSTSANSNDSFDWQLERMELLTMQTEIVISTEKIQQAFPEINFSHWYNTIDWRLSPTGDSILLFLPDVTGNEEKGLFLINLR